MNETIRTIIGMITLGISEVIIKAQENKKCPYEYIYKPKKNGCCKWRTKCAYWKFCEETTESCKKIQIEKGDPCKSHEE